MLKKDLKTKIATAIATGSLLIYAFTPLAFAATTLEISGNGSDSENTVDVTTTNTTTVVQNNDAKITNNVDANSSTGGNDANDNTGGSVTIDTGNATSSVDVSTTVNKNVADVSNCDTCNGGGEVKISGNGSDSTNTVTLDKTNTTEVFQDNKARIYNNIDADAKTGYNDANDNTGGDVTIVTGHATSDVTVDNTANANIARVGGDSGNGNGTFSATISGNGSDSDNSIDLTLDRSVTLVQDNDARIKNWVDASAKTGGNDANDNTGGDVTIGTGNAKAAVDVSNKANFNFADVDCGCLLGVSAKIAGNGSDSDNTITADLTDDLSVFQGEEKAGNKARIDNWVDASAKTGYNEAEDNTGVPNDGILVVTGHAEADQTISNTANANIFGSGLDTDSEFSLPGGLSINLSFSLGDLLNFLTSH